MVSSYLAKKPNKMCLRTNSQPQKQYQFREKLGTISIEIQYEPFEISFSGIQS